MLVYRTKKSSARQQYPNERYLTCPNKLERTLLCILFELEILTPVCGLKKQGIEEAENHRLCVFCHAGGHYVCRRLHFYWQ